MVEKTELPLTLSTRRHIKDNETIKWCAVPTYIEIAVL